MRKCNWDIENKRFHNIISSKLFVLYEKLKKTFWYQMYTVFQDYSSSFFLNRFKVEQKLDFKEALYSLNITEIFSSGRDLSGITGSMINNSYIILSCKYVFLITM